MTTTIHTTSVKKLKPIGQGGRQVQEIIQTHDSLDYEGILKLLPPGSQTPSGVRSRVAELRAHKLVVTEVVFKSGRKLRVHRAVGSLPATGNGPVATQYTVPGGGAAISVSSVVPHNDFNLRYLDQEEAFLDRFFPQPRSVKIEKVNQAWLCRFLPVRLGDRKLWYVRLGQHWMLKQSIYCPRCVSPDFGGNGDAECPVCEIADILNAEENDDISTFGFTLRANLTYLTYCLVYQSDPSRGELQDMPESEILKPWAFHHEPGSFCELMDYFRRGATPDCPSSVLDLKKGNDFWATRTTKGTRLDRQEPSPIFDPSDPNYAAKLDQVFRAISQPKIKIPTLKELETFARKAECAAFGDERPTAS